MTATFKMLSYDSASSALRWAPPTQSSPTVVTVGTGFFSASYGATEDVIFNWPGSVRTSEFIATGGRHIRIIGGASTKGAGGSAIQITGCTGSVFIEGLAIDMAAANADAINVCGNSSAPYALLPDVYIQNCRVINLNGSEATNHTDLFQAQGSIGSLFIDRVTFSSDHQGISVFQNQFPTRSAYISRVNGTYTGPGEDRTITYLLWNMDQDTSAPYKPVFIERSYFAPRAAQDLSNCVYPAPGVTNHDSAAIGVTTTDSWATASWPSITNCHGVVTSGAPSGGDWCASGVPGTSYSSPGYQSTSGYGVLGAVA